MSKDIKILAKEGVGELGGRDFDHTLYKLIAKKFKSETGKDVSEKEVDRALNIEEQKKSLSKRSIECKSIYQKKVPQILK